MLLRLIAVGAALASAIATQTIPGAWVDFAVAGGPAAYSQSSRLAFDSQRHECVLVTFDGLTNQVFTWNGTAWTARGATPFWGHCRGMAYDPVRDRIVLTTNSNQLWEWDRVAWQMRGAAPFPRSLVWDSAQQAMLSLDAQGLWRWNGSAWSLLPGSAPPLLYGAPYPGGSLAHDAARNVLVANYAPYTMMEWNGSGWSTDVSNTHPHSVYAPSLGGVIGFATTADTLRFDPAQLEWVQLAVGGAPSPTTLYGSIVNLSLAYDSHRQRVVAFVQGPTEAKVWEYDPTAVYQPRTWTLGSAWWLQDLSQALNHAGHGDRIVIPPTVTVASSPPIITKGVHIEAPTGYLLGGDLYVRPVGGSAFSLTGGRLGLLRVESTGPFELKDCVVQCETRIQASFSQLTHCTFGPGSGSCWVPLAAGITIDGPAIVDHCTATGTGGYQHFGGTFPAQAGIRCETAQPLWVIRSTLTGGLGGGWSGWGSDPAPAIELQPGGSAVVVGASSLTGAGTTAGITGTTDTLWNGATLPMSFTLPPFGWLSAPVGVALGNPLTVTGNVPAANLVYLFFGTAQPAASLPGFLLPLQLDPATVLPAALLSAANPSFTMQVPNLPTLRGLQTNWQGLDLGPVLQLTNQRAVRIR